MSECTDPVYDRTTWEMPSEWWGSVPPWLYELHTHVGASWVGAFCAPQLRERGWVYDLWELRGVRSRWRVERGGIVPAGTIRRPCPTGDEWYRWGARGAFELPESVASAHVAAIRLHEPERWRLGRWGFAVRASGGFVSGVIDDPTSRDECQGEAVEDLIDDRIGVGRRPSELGWVSPDGQLDGSRALAEALERMSGERVVINHRWWSDVAGMPSWTNTLSSDRCRPPLHPYASRTTNRSELPEKSSS